MSQPCTYKRIRTSLRIKSKRCLATDQPKAKSATLKEHQISCCIV
ncbi:Uncharacterised protein [Vibrio cholerae]|nr:Uncharacterised protein [Vibrio cholerae]